MRISEELSNIAHWLSVIHSQLNDLTNIMRNILKEKVKQEGDTPE